MLAADARELPMHAWQSDRTSRARIALSYRFHGCEVAIRYCSPSNRASSLSPQAFAQYLDEPWYCILTEWDEIEVQDEADDLGDGSTVTQDVLVRRATDDSWTIVNWQLSRYAGRWLMDSLSIN